MKLDLNKEKNKIKKLYQIQTKTKRGDIWKRGDNYNCTINIKNIEDRDNIWGDNSQRCFPDWIWLTYFFRFLLKHKIFQWGRIEYYQRHCNKNTECQRYWGNINNNRQ